MDKIEVYPYRRNSDGHKPKQPGFGYRRVYRTCAGLVQAAYSWETLLLAVVAFFIGRALLMGELLPFGAAYFAAVATLWRERKPFVFLFSVMGLATVTKGYLLAGAVATLGALYLLLPYIKVSRQQQWLAVPMEVFACTVIVKTALTAYFEPSFYNYLVIFFEALLAAILTFLCLKALAVFKGRQEPGSIPIEDLICLVIMVAGLLTGISELKVFGLAVKNIASDLIILTAALVGGSGMGAAVGTVVGFIPSITSFVAPSLIGVYAFAGVLSGLFRGFGKTGVALGFLLGLIFFSIYLTEYRNLLILLEEALIALAIFTVLPARIFEGLGRLLPGNLGFLRRRERSLGTETAARLREVAAVFDQLGRAFGEVTSGVPAREQDTLQDIFNKITRTVCQGCPNYKRCWEEEFYNTYQGILDLFTLVEVKGQLQHHKVGGSISKRCVRLQELATMVNCLFDAVQTNHYWGKRLAESREIVGGQLRGVARIMEDLAGELKVAGSRAGQPKARFSLSWGVARAPKSGSVVSGDSYSISELPGNRWLLLLSDGMGIGPRAAQESGATVTLLEKLLHTGFDKELAVKTVNSILLLRSPEETFATLDLALIDLQSGEADFMKIGSVSSFVKTGEKITVIKSASLPMGILKHIEVETNRQFLGSGDILVMVTDGVLEAAAEESVTKESWVEEALKKMPTDDPQKIANLLLLQAKEIAGGHIRDDMTVLVARMSLLS